MRAQWKTCTPSPASPSVAAFHLDFFLNYKKRHSPLRHIPCIHFSLIIPSGFCLCIFLVRPVEILLLFAVLDFFFPFFAVDICVVWTGLLLSKGACTKRHMQFQYTVYVCKCLHFSSISHLSVLKLASGFFLAPFLLWQIFIPLISCDHS